MAKRKDKPVEHSELVDFINDNWYKYGEGEVANWAEEDCEDEEVLAILLGRDDLYCPPKYAQAVMEAKYSKEAVKAYKELKAEGADLDVFDLSSEFYEDLHDNLLRDLQVAYESSIVAAGQQRMKLPTRMLRRD